MSDITPAGAPGTEQPAPIKIPMAEDIDLNKFFGPLSQQEAPGTPAPAETPAPAQTTPGSEPTPVPKAEAPKVESEIAAALREMREEREARTAVKQEAQTWKGKYEAVTEELAAIKAAPKFEDDPIAYVRSRKWTPDQQTEIVQLLAYDLAPDKAPPGFMMKVMESRDAARKRIEAEERSRREADQYQAQEAQILNQYILQLDTAVSTFGAGSYPANEDWYGDNRRAYVEDLYHLADRLATEAQSRGQRADVSAATLAATLEQTNSAKLTELETRRGRRKSAGKPADQVQATGTAQSTGSPASTQGLRQSGGPRPPATTEEERVKRAIEAAFPSR